MHRNDQWSMLSVLESCNGHKLMILLVISSILTISRRRFNVVQRHYYNLSLVGGVGYSHCFTIGDSHLYNLKFSFPILLSCHNSTPEYRCMSVNVLQQRSNSYIYSVHLTETLDTSCALAGKMFTLRWQRLHGICITIGTLYIMLYVPSNFALRDLHSQLYL